MGAGPRGRAEARAQSGLSLPLCLGAALSLATGCMGWSVPAHVYARHGLALEACAGLLSVVALLALCRVAGVEFGAPALPAGRWHAELLLGAPLLGARLLDLMGALDASLRLWEPGAGAEALLFLLFGATMLHCRQGAAEAYAAQLLMLILLRLAQGQGPDALKMLPLVATAVAASRVRYACDRRLLILMSNVLWLGQLAGCQLTWARLPVYGVAVLAVTYCTALYSRRRRHLPSGLRAAKFVSLRYLRHMLAEGIPIRRCQELPEEAFGDPSKALHLIPVSHRWLDPLSCDIATDEYPRGLRLTTLVQRLEEHFSPAGRRRAGSWKEWLLSLRSVYFLGGEDVLVFFDFMALPQDGEGQPRSARELELFGSCMPHMGTLYSTFPTLVLTDVAGGAHGYFQSGWCFGEFCTALLGDNLKRYSEDALVDFDEGTMCLAAEQDVMNVSDANRFSSECASVLPLKSFRVRSDLAIVQGMVRGFLLKRLLLDAVRIRDAARCSRLLKELASRGILQTTLAQPVDASLNTVLHVAVRIGGLEITELLLEHGADPSTRNRRGDRPSQCLALPRCSAAARAVRRARLQGNGEAAAPPSGPISPSSSLGLFSFSAASKISSFPDHSAGHPNSTPKSAMWPPSAAGKDVLEVVVDGGPAGESSSTISRSTSTSAAYIVSL